VVLVSEIPGPLSDEELEKLLEGLDKRRPELAKAIRGSMKSQKAHEAKLARAKAGMEEFYKRHPKNSPQDSDTTDTTDTP
jgi:hypothetical protein